VARVRRVQSITNVSVQQLSDVGRDVIEGRIQVGADPLSRRDDGDRDKASNQRIFDRGCTALVAQESTHQLVHAVLHRDNSTKKLYQPAYSQVNANT
jgi:hypothetical protein